MMHETERKSASYANTTQPIFRVNLGTLPMIVIGFLIVIFALREAPWEADYVNASPWDIVSHWQLATGDDVPDGMEVERAQGYEMRRLLDFVIYGTIPLGAVTILLLGIFNNPSLFAILMGIGFYGIIYAGSTGLTGGPLMTAGGYALILVSATLGWLTSYGPDEELDEDTRATV